MRHLLDLMLNRRTFESATGTHLVDRWHRFDIGLIATMNTLFFPIVKVFVGFFVNLNFRYVRSQRHPFFVII